MYQFNILIYFLILGTSIYSKNWLLTLAVLLAGVLIIALMPTYRKTKKENIRKQIEKYPNSQVINVNKASWWEFEELPCFQRVSAKKAVWIRKHNGRYLSKEDFIEKNNIKDKDSIIKLIGV